MPGFRPGLRHFNKASIWRGSKNLALLQTAVNKGLTVCLFVCLFFPADLLRFIHEEWCNTATSSVSFRPAWKRNAKQKSNYYLWTFYSWTAGAFEKVGSVVAKGKERKAVKAASKQSGSLLQYKSTMWGVIAHCLKKLLSHAAKKQVDFDRWGSRQGYITHNYPGDINQMQVALKRLKGEMKGDNQHFEVNTWLCRPSSGSVQWCTENPSGAETRVKSLIMTASLWVQRLQKCFSGGQNEEDTGVHTSLLLARESHVALTWCSRTSCWVLRAKKRQNMHYKFAICSVCRVSRANFLLV